jgi:hypothetical protein
MIGMNARSSLPSRSDVSWVLGAACPLGIGRVAETPEAAAHDADVVISSLTGPEAVLPLISDPVERSPARTGSCSST